jgi:hypothetical protein
MNPYRIYRDEWTSALARQATAKEYTTFVAMPFREHFSYRSGEVFSKIIAAAIKEANFRAEAPRRFAYPERVDVPRGATVITEEIILGILGSHFFIADLTFENPGVILETGIALGTKPNRQVIAITQGSLRELHFDLRNNYVISYGKSGAVREIASALIDAAKHFEEQVHHYILGVRQRIGPDSLALLNWYGHIQQKNVHFSLHPRNRGPNLDGPDGIWRFDAATRELRDNKLLWTDYRKGAVKGGDAYGMHATEFGWAVIEDTWPELRQSDASIAAAQQRFGPTPGARSAAAGKKARTRGGRPSRKQRAKA